VNISEAAQKAGLSTKTIRYYESIQLVLPTSRSPNGYRIYHDTEVRQLTFVHQARELGFTLEECKELLGLYKNQHRHSADVKALALEKVEDIDQKIAKLQHMRNGLAELAESCHGDSRSECPILERLSEAPVFTET